MSWSQSHQTLASALFTCTVRVIVRRRSGADLNPPEVATAFAIQSPGGTEQHLYLVTARHVVEKADAATLIFFSALDHQPEQRFFYFELENRFNEIWYYPRDRDTDLAITPVLRNSVIEQQVLKAGGKVIVDPVWDNTFRSALRQSDANFIRPFEEVLFVGYPEGFWDRLHGLPIIRRGVTASRYDVDYEGQPNFLIDGAIYPGNSGSPVVVIERRVAGLEAHMLGIEMQGLHESERYVFLGMITDVFHRPGGTRDEYRNLGLVLKSSVIHSLIDDYERLVGSPATA